MVTLGRRVSKLEKRVALQSRTGSLEDQSVYQPSEEDLAEAVAILVKCGAVREVATDALVDESKVATNQVIHPYDE